MENIRKLDQVERLMVLWFRVKGKASLDLRPKRPSPPTIKRVWAWLLARDSQGRFIRPATCLDGLRLRSKAYRLQGHPSSLCAEYALNDVAGLIGRFEDGNGRIEVLENKMAPRANQSVLLGSIGGGNSRYRGYRNDPEKGTSYGKNSASKNLLPASHPPARKFPLKAKTPPPKPKQK